MIEAANADETNHFTVDWDGPDDPNNPKKSDSQISLGLKRLNTFSQLVVPQKMGSDSLGIGLHFP